MPRKPDLARDLCVATYEHTSGRLNRWVMLSDLANRLGVSFDETEQAAKKAAQA